MINSFLQIFNLYYSFTFRPVKIIEWMEIVQRLPPSPWRYFQKITSKRKYNFSIKKMIAVDMKRARMKSWKVLRMNFQIRKYDELYTGRAINNNTIIMIIIYSSLVRILPYCVTCKNFYRLNCNATLSFFFCSVLI